MTKAVLGIIGGSGLYDLPGLEKVREELVASPWGAPSAPLRIGEIAGLPIAFMSRHDKGHRLSPSDINYRANIDALKRVGVTHEKHLVSHVEHGVRLGGVGHSPAAHDRDDGRPGRLPQTQRSRALAHGERPLLHHHGLQPDPFA